MSNACLVCAAIRNYPGDPEAAAGTMLCMAIDIGTDLVRASLCPLHAARVADVVADLQVDGTARKLKEALEREKLR
jgi:hypothetical protein